MGALVLRLNDQQRAFAYFYVKDPDTTANGTQSAIRAGFAAGCARQTACRLLQHDGVRAEIERLTRQELGDHASAAVQLLGRVVRDEKAPLKVRVDACKTILDRAGFIAPKAPDAPPPPLDPVNYDSMPLDKLLRMLAALDAKIETAEAMIDVTPGVDEAETVADSDPPTAG